MTDKEILNRMREEYKKHMIRDMEVADICESVDEFVCHLYSLANIAKIRFEKYAEYVSNKNMVMEFSREIDNYRPKKEL